ncbi:mechanosensitive ion channel [Sphingomonas sp. AP4-R1]|uniref:mechanosensitive ion channel family protein n=1 Tax=Sphingomonas sp. AP4-R1 TaxID=2735134 RepID=UPI001493333D|nr:mechanosensitive ion channel domain-containing protein [Sphingomonas sp. AP4-R1]QJU59112.1 mechanosensitive ion channel [Sphingomonas sp. AP4-R1]
MLTSIPGIPPWLSDIAAVALVILGALIFHKVAMYVAVRAARRTSTVVDDLMLECLSAPIRWLLVALSVSALEPALNLSEGMQIVWRRVLGIVMPALLGWLAVRLLGAMHRIVQAQADISVEDNLRARRRRTRSAILNRVAVLVVVGITFCLMLMSIPSIRSIGVTLIASAGLAALAIGAAAQPTLKNLIAGLQMAFTEPIRLDDVVIMDGEWGRIEDIRLTYVVVRIWDDRRLVVPVSKFLEESFQNWTRETSQLMGSVFWQLDPATDIARLREKLGEIIRANPRWDRRFFNLQVTEARVDSIEVRALMTARDASVAFDLRCDVREAMLDFMRTEMPEAFTRNRADLVIQSTGAEVVSSAG